ncbi:MAG: putative tRNA-dihydrouridine synthase [Chlamydiae bacterium]|nr:putative tRNA-dihydrouridine synthase [Chlamydiota bacterium]
MPKISIGSKTFSSNVFYAPLAGCSDLPFRQMAKKYGAGLAFCEMVKMDALIRNDKNTYRLLDYTGDMHPMGAQLCGSRLDIAADCAEILEDLGFDLIDLNCGCPVDKVTKDGSGSGLLKKPELIGEIISKIVARVSVPVTVKIRAGWDDDSIVAPLITQIAEEAGAGAIFIHGRTRQQAYKGLANRDHIKESKAVAKNIKVFGNGDIFCAQDAKDMFEHTGCDGVLVARGTFGQPWVAEDIRRMQENLPALERDFEFVRENLLEHYRLTRSYANEKKAILDMRRVGCWYFKKGEIGRALRSRMSKAKTIDDVEFLLESLKDPEAFLKQLATT